MRPAGPDRSGSSQRAPGDSPPIKKRWRSINAKVGDREPATPAGVTSASGRRRAMRRFTVSPRAILGMCLLAVIIQSAEAHGAAPPAVKLDGQYPVEFKSAASPKGLSARVAALGGTIVDRMPDIGVAVLANLTDSASETLTNPYRSGENTQPLESAGCGNRPVRRAIPAPPTRHGTRGRP